MSQTTEQTQVTGGSALQQESPKKKKNKFKLQKKHITSTLCVGLMAVGGVQGYNLFFLEEPAEIITGKISYGGLGTLIEGSGSTTSEETQSVSVASSSEVLGVYVTAGDEILEGQLLYVQDDSEIDDRIDVLYEQIETYNETIETYNSNIDSYNDNIDDYNDTISDYYETIEDYNDDISDFYDDIADLQDDISDLTVTADFAGKITEVMVKANDTVTASTKLAQLTSSVDLDVVLYFSYAYENDIYVGQSAMVSIPDQMLTLNGKVSGVKMVEYITREGTKCFAVTITVPNPGSLTAGTEVSATIGTIYPVEAGTMNNVEDTSITPPSAGVIETVYVSDYQNVTVGQKLFTLDSSTFDTQIEAVYDSIEATQDRIEDTQEMIVDTQERIADTQEQIVAQQEKIAEVNEKIAEVHEDIAEVELEREDFEVYSEISGKVITVNVREGYSPNTVQPAVVIYNMDTMQLTANIDELDMEHVSMGMDVDISYSSGGSNLSFTGTVSSMSYEATNDSGVAYFPIVISVDSAGAISSGVNVSYSISVGDTEEGYLVPVDALKQSDEGTCVYIEGVAPSGASVVEVEEGAMPEGYYAQLVEISTSNSQYALVRDGLTEGMTVFTRYQVASPTNGSTTSASGSQEMDMDAMMAMREAAMASGGMNSGTTERPSGTNTGGGGRGG